MKLLGDKGGCLRNQIIRLKRRSLPLHSAYCATTEGGTAFIVIVPRLDPRHAAIMARPIGLAQRLAADLAHRRARQGIGAELLEIEA